MKLIYLFLIFMALLSFGAFFPSGTFTSTSLLEEVFENSNTSSNNQLDSYDIYLLAVDSGYTSSFQEWLSNIRGEDGKNIEFNNDNNILSWRYIGSEDWNELVSLSAIKQDEALVGLDGQDGSTPYIGVNGHWWIDLTDTNVKANNQGEKGEDGLVPRHGENGHWWIGSIDTNIPASGNQGSSAYEVYLKNNPEYTKSEAVWLQELVLGKFNSESYLVTFNTLGGTDIEPQLVKSGLKVKEPSKPVKPGHDFLGWFAEEERWVFIGFAVTEDVELVARWSPTIYQISYVLNGGINDSRNPSSYAFNSTINLFDPTRGGYVFAGWYKEASFLNKIEAIIATDVGDLTLHASWEALPGYTIFYELNGGVNSPFNFSNISFESSSLSLINPTRTGYVFDGWYKESFFSSVITEINPLTMVANITVYAKWTIISVSDPFTVSIILPSTDNFVTATDTSTTIKRISTIKFTPTSSGYYEIYSRSSQDTYGLLYGPNGNLIASDDDSGSGANFSINEYLYAGTRYYIRSHLFFTSATGSWDVLVRKTRDEAFINYVSVSLDTTYSVVDNLTTLSSFGYFKFVPSQSGNYRFFSMGSKDTMAIIVTNDFQFLTGDLDGGEGFNFRINFYMVSGQSYYIATQLELLSDTGTYTVKMIQL